MRHLVPPSLILLLPVLLGSVIVDDRHSARKIPETREAYETFIRQMDEVIGSQVREIEELSCSTDPDPTAASFRTWRAALAADCGVHGGGDGDELADLKCVADGLESKYQDFEIRIVELEVEREASPCRSASRLTNP